MADWNAQQLAILSQAQAEPAACESQQLWGSSLHDPDTTVPVVGGFSPALGGTIQSSQPITFDVTDDSGAFRRVLVHARFADGLEEVVHNGTAFRGLYQTTSARVLIAGGFRYTILRSGGWPQGGPVAVNVFAIDAVGNEAS